MPSLNLETLPKGVCMDHEAELTKVRAALQRLEEKEASGEKYPFIRALLEGWLEILTVPSG